MPNIYKIGVIECDAIIKNIGNDKQLPKCRRPPGVEPGFTGYEPEIAPRESLNR